jgi:hypothetical protein
LIEYNADVNAAKNESRSVMDVIIERGYTEILKQRLIAAADRR